ncbi:hypothetical protein FNF27_01704 [Cafeteria roenbergensis]|uniref:Uncharacterized protein n=1 Tax=Cafeteria roenbergensis TaxID=33653 RepID=A0A5A8E2J8_CAFRO|nr:hypothetical protein FNF29_03890 [Cafeteria roenbergensis]KAA0171689.1 hypothetical protein FNF28_00622 [Cafeteria roenbergensis]KAA0176882.1 hypothetical protein FNF27_01704 [Cafeteria roenbergensis]|eukprot:KAA0152324.1 hypothetical protein FNF29_03890 [Cafeteria roenbergensis]
MAAFELEAAEGWGAADIVRETGLPALAASPLLPAPSSGASDAPPALLPRTVRVWAAGSGADICLCWGEPSEASVPAPSPAACLPLRFVARIGLIEEGRLDDALLGEAALSQGLKASVGALADKSPFGLLAELDLGGRCGARLAVELWTATDRDRQRLSRAIVRLRAAARKADRADGGSA